MGAETSVHLCSSNDVEGITGEYFYNCKIAKTTKWGEEEDADRLWNLSKELTRIMKKLKELNFKLKSERNFKNTKVKQKAKEIAIAIGKPKSFRAVANACGKIHTL